VGTADHPVIGKADADGNHFLDATLLKDIVRLGVDITQIFYWQVLAQSLDKPPPAHR
jgi:hypothetical protein